MKVSLKFFRFSLVLLLALTVAFSAAVGVSAADGTANGALLYTNASNNVVRVTENSSLVIDTDNMGFRTPLTYQAQNTYVVTVTIAFSYFSPPDLFTDETTCAYYGNTTISNESQFNLSNLDNINVIVTSNNSTQVKYTLTFNTNNIDSSANLLQYFFTPNLGTGNNDIDFQYINTTVSYTYDPNETTLEDINNQLEDIKNNQQSNNAEVQEALTSIINNQIIQNNNWTTIINYGSNYNQIDQTLINNLGTAEDQLSSAEGALEDKSQSLKDSVASQWSNIQSTSKTFITNLAPAAAAVGTVTTQFMDAAPEEVKGLFVTIPLLIFIGWLIGRIRGD